ncbi:cyclic nucleotide-binding-like protein [Blyttiomyces helicus]|uniref:Cyclic nucleotide-binding-like protein n=1 Tax=Blyttiomyces helicus TaxID=388810 RepID=A0A4P9WRY1_9FUNG|nr:cyclic nucleotide-binding-like protein [Blyttiomyces helicus]|eukprot:RKO94678.1 cyclic nucleotide-binding-like protein [Blyttiomyces helicus]
MTHRDAASPAKKDFSSALRSRIVEFYELKYSGGTYLNEKAILKELNSPLRRIVAVHNCKHLILQVPFFKEADNKFITELSLFLEERHFLEGDLIMSEGDEAEEMYFIWTGTCAVSIQGVEIALLFSGMRRTATITAVSPCVLYSLSKHNLDTVFDRFENMAESVHKVAHERLANFGKAAGTAAPPPPPQDPPSPPQDPPLPRPDPSPTPKILVIKSRLLRDDESEGVVWKSLD